MLLIFPVGLVVLGLCFGAGLVYASHRMRGRLKSIENARPVKAGNPGTGHVKLQGTARAVNPDELLTSPIEQRRCVYYRLVIEHFQSGTVRAFGLGTYRSSSGGGTWVPVLEDVEAIPMVVADETGEVAVDPREAQLDMRINRRHANLFTSLPPDIEDALKARYKLVTKTWFIPKQMRYTEVVIEEGADVFVMGDCVQRDGKTNLVKRDNPLLISFRNEAQVLRNGKIGLGVMLALAVIFPLLFFGLAGLALSEWWSKGHNQNAQAGSNDPTQQAINKLKNRNAGLSERAWAARKLAETPVQKNRVNDVAPHFNPLLESKDGFHRESAVMAIKKGWGSTTNERALRRALDATPDARGQQEVQAALDTIGR
jgi:hypothetical protein